MGSDRRQRAKQAVGVVLKACREVEVVRVAAGAVVAGRDGPETGDLDRLTVGAVQLADVKIASLNVGSKGATKIIIVIVIIEIISYVMRALSLGIRLAANMFAGHTLLKILAGFAWKMFTIGGIIAVAGLAPLGVVFALTFLEMGVAVLQAYVFTVLTCSYLNDAINLH